MKRITFGYPGGKARLASALVEMMPKTGRLYCEPFAGRGNVFFQAAQRLRFDYWLLNDTQTTPFFGAIKRHGDLFAATVPHTVRLQDDVYLLGKVLERESAKCKTEVWTALDDEDEMVWSYAAALEPQLTFSGSGYSHGRKPRSSRGVSPAGMARMLTTAHELMNRLDVKLSHWDWHNFVPGRRGIPHYDYQTVNGRRTRTFHRAWLDRLQPLNDQDLFFCDPPYYGCNPGAYDCSRFDHSGFVKWLKEAPFRWMLTEYRQDFYVKAFGEPFWTKEVQVTCGGRKQSKATECVWKNY